jgi:hypothetical protein
MYYLEQRLRCHPVGEDSLGGTLDAVKAKAVDQTAELAKWFIGLALSLIGATAYYIKAKPGEQAPPSRFSRVATILTLFGAVLSIGFGHLWLANLRSMLANDYLILHSPSMAWPERLQYMSFLSALGWFALLTLERETAQRPPAPAPAPLQVMLHHAAPPAPGGSSGGGGTDAG